MKYAQWLLGLLLLAPNVKAQVVPAPPLMNFQGRLAKPDGTPLPDGTHQVIFSLWNAPSGGVQQWSQTFPALATRNGAFAALLNVGTAPATLFNNNLYFQIQVDGAAPLTPRQQVATVAYAFKANTVPDGSIGTTQLAPGSVTSTILAPSLLGSFGASSMWSLLGNSGTNSAVNFLGTTDNQPLLLKANGFRGLGLYPTVGATGSPFRSMNFIGGSDGNYIDTGVAGAVIAGGGYFDTNTGGNYRNQIYDNFGAIGGGAANICGTLNYNAADSPYTTVSGGFGNIAGAQFAVIGGGNQNQALSLGSVISGGNLNNASGQYAVVGGGSGCTAASDYSTVSGGFSNFATAQQASVGGGLNNFASAQGATTAGGFTNTAGGLYSAVGGGNNNSASGANSAVPGGQFCVAQGTTSFAAGNNAKAMNQGAFVWADSQTGNFTSAVNNSFIIRSAGGVGINTNNPAGFALNVTGSGNFSGTVTAGGILLISDARYKTNVQAIPNALDSILHLRGVTYDWRRAAYPDRNFPEGQQLGFIAQEVEKVLPALVHKDANGYYSVAYASAVPILVEAVKQQEQEIQALKAKNAQIASDNVELKRQAAHIAQLEKQMTALIAASHPKKAAQVARK